jgi:deoxyribodipyrimidine photo-lyase
MTQQPWGLHWFRRDLRVPGNASLRHNWKQNQGRVLGLFCFDSAFLSRSDFSHNRFAFFIKTMRALRAELQAQGSDLLVVDGLPQQVFPKLFAHFKTQPEGLPSLVTFGRDYEPFARARDLAVTQTIEAMQVKVHTERDHILIEPWEIKKGAEPNSFYQVYSPFARRWFEHLETPEVQARLAAQAKAESYYERLQAVALEKVFTLTWNEFAKAPQFPFQDALDRFESENQKSVNITIPEAGFAAAFSRLREFKASLSEYGDKRDIPSLDGTSKLSLYLKNGSLVSSQILQFLSLGRTQMKAKGGPTQYTKEIAWREFYYSILYHRPDVEKNSFLAQYVNLPWENDEAKFKRWCEGTTGFPIVDAGMRQLNQTGWMHNRVRMIVASFLVKDLLINWQWGENYFMKQLLDGDLAPNNGGWQWAASTGCDPQPYFRIFNPWLQGERFDPEAKYIREFVPELRGISPAQIHAPDADRSAAKYPAPMVVHAEQKDKALALFQGARDKMSSN